MKKWKWICAFMLGAILIGFYLITPRPEARTGLSADKLCRKLLLEKENQEALNWLQQSKPGDIRTIGEQNPEESLKIVRDLYSSGAVKAHVVEIERVAGYGETTNIVCVELPKETSSREKLFKAESKVASSEGFDPVPDEGQTYLFLYKFKLSPYQTLRTLLHLRN